MAIQKYFQIFQKALHIYFALQSNLSTFVCRQPLTTHAVKTFLSSIPHLTVLLLQQASSVFSLSCYVGRVLTFKYSCIKNHTHDKRSVAPLLHYYIFCRGSLNESSLYLTSTRAWGTEDVEECQYLDEQRRNFPSEREKRINSIA